MKRDRFEKHLSEAIRLAIDVAQRYVKQDLPSQLVFDVYPNQSCDENPLVEDEQLFPGDSRLPDDAIQMETEAQVVEFLWREEKVPEWIDINVASATKQQTCLRLLCCGRFTATAKLLYHQRGGIPPFSVKSPYLPPGYDSEAEPETQRFDVNWQYTRKKR
jgi:hypothetical protein